jgi:uncharacterized MAPEG superfamily protein
MSSDRLTPGSPTSSAAQPTPCGAARAQAGDMLAVKVFVAAVVVIVVVGVAAGLTIVLSLH